MALSTVFHSLNSTSALIKAVVVYWAQNTTWVAIDMAVASLLVFVPLTCCHVPFCLCVSAVFSTFIQNATKWRRKKKEKETSSWQDPCLLVFRCASRVWAHRTTHSPASLWTAPSCSVVTWQHVTWHVLISAERLCWKWPTCKAPPHCLAKTTCKPSQTWKQDGLWQNLDGASSWVFEFEHRVTVTSWIQFRSVQFKTVSRCLGRTLGAPPHLSVISPV